MRQHWPEAMVRHDVTGTVASTGKDRRDMGFARMACGLFLSIMLLSSCNTTDALTPRVDVGGGSSPSSSPVTENDLQQMAETQQPVYPNAQSAQPVRETPVSRQPIATPALEGASSGDRPVKPGPGAAPSTLSQQAARLGGGDGSSRVGNTLAPASPAAGVPETSTAANQTPDSKMEDRTIRFLPIIGAPLQAVTPLSRQLGAEARSRGLVILSSSDTTAHHVLKGYFSAASGGGTITVTYVWDIIGQNGAQLNRIQGQENVPGTASDPWTAVPASVMQNIATKTMDSYSKWRAGP